MSRDKFIRSNGLLNSRDWETIGGISPERYPGELNRLREIVWLEKAKYFLLAGVVVSSLLMVVSLFEVALVRRH